MTEEQQTMQKEDLSPLGKKFFELIEFDKEERLIAEIRKDSWGLFLIYLTGFFIAAIMLAVSIFAVKVMGSETAKEVAGFRGWVMFIGLVLVALSVVVTFIGAVLYKSNVVYITNQKIAQVIYTSLFNRKISQLTLGDIQDVTVKQSGLFPRLFNYGTIVVETAGEQNNYIFTYAPKPYEVSKKIIYAHEKNIAQYGN